MKQSPPRLFLRFFRWYCHAKLRDYIEGDLMEVYNARVKTIGKAKADWKFVTDVLLLFRPGIIKPMKGYSTLTTFGMYRSYLIVALRNLLKQKALNIFNVLGLAVGIASGLIIAIHIRGELSYETSYKHYQNIYRVHRNGWATSSPPLAGEFRDFFPQIEAIGRFSAYGTRVVNTEGNNPGEATGYYADSSVLKIFGFEVIAGDAHPLVAVNTVAITRQMATRFFARESPIGKVLKFDNGAEMTVTALIENPPVKSHLQFDFLVSMPTFYQERGPEDVDHRRGWMTMYSYAKLRVGAVDGVVARMPDFIRKYYASDPDVDQEVQSGGWRLMPLKDIHLHSHLEKEMRPNGNILYIYVLLAVELLILIVASANFMSLFTTQALRRVKEVGMRKVMGAKPRQLVMQYLTEVSLLIALSTGLAILLYQLALPFYNDLTGNSLSPVEVFETQNMAIIGMVLLAVLAISGLYPAIFIAGFKPGSFLREGKLPNSLPNLIRSGLLVFQFVVSVSLIAAALIVAQQMHMMKNKDLGFDKEQVVTVKLYGDLWEKALAQDNAFKHEFLKSPDILAVGRTDRLIGERLSVESVGPAGLDEDDERVQDLRVLRVDEGYLDAMNIRLLQGRNFSPLFNDSNSFIINESAAKALGLANPVNEILVNHSNERTGNIIGVVSDYHFATLHAQIEPLVIEFKPQWTDDLVFRVRAGKTREALAHIKAAVDRLSPHTLFIYQFLDDRIDALYRSEDTMGKVFLFFSVLAVIIACMGLFGVASYAIERRTKEIGIRKVLGASVARIISLVSGGIFRLIVMGFAIAVPLTWYFMQKWLNDFAYKIEIEWWMFALAGVIIMAIGSLSIGLRVLKAAGSNPVDSLRSE